MGFTRERSLNSLREALIIPQNADCFYLLSGWWWWVKDTLQVKKMLRFCPLLSMFILITHLTIREIIGTSGPGWVRCEA